MRVLLTAGLLLFTAVCHAQQGATVVRVPPPKYPQQDLMAGHNGTVLVRVEIAADGRALNAVVSKSSGYPTLDTAALTAIKSGTYTPARDAAGNDVPSISLIPITFESGVDSPEKQRDDLLKMLGMSCVQFQTNLLKIASDEQRDPSYSMNFRFPLSLFETLMQSEGKLKRTESLTRNSEAIYKRFDRYCSKDQGLSAYDVFAKALGYRPRT